MCPGQSVLPAAAKTGSEEAPVRVQDTGTGEERRTMWLKSENITVDEIEQQIRRGFQ